MADRIFDEPLRAIHVIASYTKSTGWHLDVVIRREGEHWLNADRHQYRRLSRAELADVIEAVCTDQLRSL